MCKKNKFEYRSDEHIAYVYKYRIKSNKSVALKEMLKKISEIQKILSDRTVKPIR